MRPFIIGAEGFRFGYIHLNLVGLCFTLVYCLPYMILKCVCGIYVDGLDVVFRYEIVYFLVEMLCR